MEEKAHEAARHPLAGVYDAVIGPLIAFFRAHGLGMAALMLAMISLYHLCDYMRGPMTGPYYEALKIDNDTIGLVRLFVGTPGSFVGIALGGFSAYRFGRLPTLIVGAIAQPLAIGAFAVLGWHGGDFALISLGAAKITAFEAIMAFDAVAIGFSGVALVTYMSSLTSLGYTATQYALLTSALAFLGKTAKSFSGFIVEALEPGRSLLDAYALFYVASAAVAVPAIVLCCRASLGQARSHQGVRSSSPPIRASPAAIDSSSAPVLIFPDPKRCSNKPRTAGTNDEPPVRKTWSIAAGLSLALASASSTASSIAARSRAIQCSKSARSTSASERDVAGVEGEARPRSATESASFSREID